MGCPGKFSSSENESSSPIHWEDCGYEIGDHACDFTLLDQDGELWNLYSHYGAIMVLDFGTEWCSYCHLAADSTQEVQDKYDSHGFYYVTIMIEDIAGNSPPTSQALTRWAEHFEITAPIVAGSREMLDTGDGGWPITAWPTFYIVDDDLVIRAIIVGYSEESLSQAIDSLISPS